MVEVVSAIIAAILGILHLVNRRKVFNMSATIESIQADIDAVRAFVIKLIPVGSIVVAQSDLDAIESALVAIVPAGTGGMGTVGTV